MIQQILRKRFWYEVVYEPKKCDFYWNVKCTLATEKPYNEKKDINILIAIKFYKLLIVKENNHE